MFTTGRNNMIPRGTVTMGMQKVMLAQQSVWFHRRATIWSTYNHDYFIDNISSDFLCEKMWFCHWYWYESLFIHMDNSNDCIIIAWSSDTKLECLLHLPYSSYFGICNFWLFGIFEHKIKDGLFQTIEGRDRDLGRLEIRRHPIRLL
jgi:hypothetical protein